MTSKNRKIILLTIIIISFVSILIATFIFAEHLSRKNTPKKIYDVIKNLSLIDHKGDQFNKASLNGKPSLLFFGFTHCPDICPTTLALFNSLSDKLQDTDFFAATQFLLVSLDPARDTPEALKTYIQYFNPAFVGVTGDFLLLEELLSEYVYAASTSHSSITTKILA